MAIDRESYMNQLEIKQLRTVTEAKSLVDLAAGRIGGVKAWMLVDLALQTGLRVSEIANIKISDVDSKRGAVIITRLKRKTKRSETMPLPEQLVKHLCVYIKWLNHSAGTLFGVKSQALQKTWKVAIKRAGLPKSLSIHSARHSFGTHHYAKNLDLVATQRLLGHASPATTAAMYIGTTFEGLQESMNGIYDEEVKDAK